MENKYKPNAREVLTELYRFAKEEELPRIEKSTKEFLKYLMGTAAVLTLSPYAIPTVRRLAMEGQPCTDNTPINNPIPDNNTSVTIPDNVVSNTHAENWGIGLGLISGIAIDTGQVLGVYYAAQHGHYEVLFIPVATNVASGLYELGRKVYKKAEQRVVASKTDRNNLEKLADSTN